MLLIMSVSMGSSILIYDYYDLRTFTSLNLRVCDLIFNHDEKTL